MSMHVYRREGGEKKVRNSVYVECECPLSLLIDVRSGVSEAENFTYTETVKNFSTYFCSTDLSATNFAALKISAL